MAFKIKDLMINLLPSETQGCGCTVMTCGETDICGETYDTDDEFVVVLRRRPRMASRAALSALKEELKRRLAEVEKRQAAAEERLLPQTLEEIDMLTKKLNDALEELKGRRAALSTKSEPAGDK